MKPHIPQNSSPHKHLDQEALSSLLDEDSSTEYCLVVHNRQVESIQHGVWGLLLSKSSKTLASQLRSLDLSFNSIQRLGPHTLSPLSELRELKLYANKLTDEGLIVCGLEKLNRLENLELHDNRFKHPPQCIESGSTKLQTLRLERNQLETLENLNKCRALATLTVDGNRLRGLCDQNGRPWLFTCISLVHLSCCDNELEFLSIKSFSGCKNLAELSLSRNCLKEDSLSSLKAVSDTLRCLRLDGNHLTSLAKCPNMKKLEELYVSGNRLTEGGIDNLPLCVPHLEVLDIAQNRIEGSVTESIGVPLRKLSETLRELACEGNPCCSGGSAWWHSLAQSLPRLDLLDDRKVTSTSNGLAIPALALGLGGPGSARPLSARPTSARPMSARRSVGTPRSGSLGTPRSGGGLLTPRSGGERPVMHPPSSRTGYGTDLKVDALEDVEAMAQGFRNKVNSLRNSIHSNTHLAPTEKTNMSTVSPRTTVSTTVKRQSEVKDTNSEAEDEKDTRSAFLTEMDTTNQEVSTIKTTNQQEAAAAVHVPLHQTNRIPLKTTNTGNVDTSKDKAVSKDAKRSHLTQALGFAAKGGDSPLRDASVFGNLSEPPPPPRMVKPWERAEAKDEDNGVGQEAKAEVKDSKSLPSLDFDTIRLSSGDQSIELPQPSPRYQRETTVDRKTAPTAAEKKGNLKSFKIPAKAHEQLKNNTPR